jgi:hypothetical protein
MTQPQARSARQRQFITLDLPPEQVAWLDQQAGDIMSRSAFARLLIANAIKAGTTLSGITGA